MMKAMCRKRAKELIVLRREDGHVSRRALEFEVEHERKKGRMKKTWKKQVEEESVKAGLSR